MKKLNLIFLSVFFLSLTTINAQSNKWENSLLSNYDKASHETVKLVLSKFDKYFTDTETKWVVGTYYAETNVIDIPTRHRKESIIFNELKENSVKFENIGDIEKFAKEVFFTDKKTSLNIFGATWN